MPSSVKEERIALLTGPVFVSGVLGFGAVAWVSVSASGLFERTRELWRVATEGAAAEPGVHLVKTVGELVPFLTAEILSAFGAGPAAFTVVTVLTAAGLIAFIARSFARRGWPVWQALAAVVAISLHPVWLAGAVGGDVMLLRALAWFALITWLYRIEFVDDVQSRMSFGIVLGFMVLSDPNAIYTLGPIAVLMPWILTGMREPEQLLAGYILILLPAAISVLAVAFAHIILTGQAPWSVFGVWLAPLHGSSFPAWWNEVHGGTFLEPLWRLGALGLVTVPLAALMLVQGLHGRLRDLPHTAAVSAGVPVAAGALATFLHHQASAWPVMLNLLLASAAWLCKAHLSSRARTAALILLAAGTIFAWTYEPLWREAQFKAWGRVVLTGW
jgi:hypothetical protein